MFSFFKNGPTPASFHLFSSFQTHITIFTTNKCEKCPSSIWCWDSNSQPLEHEFPPITTRPGLPPLNIECLYANLLSSSTNGDVHRVLLDEGWHARAVGDDILQDGLVQAVLDRISEYRYCVDKISWQSFKNEPNISVQHIDKQAVICL